MLKLNTLSGFGSGAAAAGVAGNAYFLGGHRAGVHQVAAEKLTFATNTTVTTTTADLSLAKSYAAPASDITALAGYVGAGQTSGGKTNTTDKLEYASDTTAAETTANTTLTVHALAGTSDGATYGYFSGGNSDARTAATDKLTYATDTTAADVSADLTHVVYDMPGLSSLTDGYIAGGDTGAPDTETVLTDKLVFSSGTTSAVATANLVRERRLHAGCSGDDDKGFWTAGYEAGSVAETEKIVYSTDTTTAITTADLSSGRYGTAGTSDGSVNGYFAGGASIITGIEKLEYATEVMTTDVSRDLNLGRTNISALSSVSG